MPRVEEPESWRAPRPDACRVCVHRWEDLGGAAFCKAPESERSHRDPTTERARSLGGQCGPEARQLLIRGE